jgi:GST-like protein
MAELTLYGATGSGSIAVEAALTLLDIPYTLIEAVTWDPRRRGKRCRQSIPCARFPPSFIPGAR